MHFHMTKTNAICQTIFHKVRNVYLLHIHNLNMSAGDETKLFENRLLYSHLKYFQKIVFEFTMFPKIELYILDVFYDIIHI